jgi:serine/threonine protein kinase
LYKPGALRLEQGSPRYKILRPLGRGAYGVVFLAHDNNLDRDIALKVLDIPEGSDEEDTQRHIDMFQREARAAASLLHPNIVTVYDISRTRDKHFITMEFVEGDKIVGMVTYRDLVSYLLPEICYMAEVAY